MVIYKKSNERKLLFQHITHEFKNISQCLYHGYEAKQNLNRLNLDKEERKEYKKELEASQDAGICFMKNLIDKYCVYEHRKSEIMTTEFKMSEVVSNVDKIIGTMYYEDDSKEIVFAENDTLNCKIISDKNAIQQIYLNLILNSIKHSESECVSISTEIRDSNLVFSVLNEGVLDCNLKEMFNENVLSNTVDGSGLGLYVSKTLVERLNGTIECSIIEDVILTHCVIPVG